MAETTPLIGEVPRDTAKQGKPLALVRKLSSYIRGSSSGHRVFGEISEETVRGFVPLGIITLEDVIEELIQEEIIDETDVFVDMRRKIKVMRAVKLAQSLAASPMPVPVTSGDVATEPQASSKRRGVAFSSRRRNEEQGNVD
ncbi:hypothetical protein GGH91_006356 [Coemansia sp. RSA 2671]|nr:hypothetical protein GGH91_006356 [Coemansia sp. RSA 2671]